MANNFCIMGCDPGLSGAIAFYFPTFPQQISVKDMPVVDNQVDAAALTDLILQMKPDLAICEMVGARPGQGVSSMFNFGVSFGRLTGVITSCHVPLHFVTPAKWKKHFRLPADKEASRAYAVRMWPQSDHFRRKKDEGRAEASLIARYGAETIAHHLTRETVNESV